MAGEPCNVNGFFFTQLCLSVFPEYLKALQNTTAVVILLVNSSCSILGKPCSPLSLFAIVSKNLSSTEGIYEQQSCINHLPSSTAYIQTFLFVKCNFLFPIHSFSKCTWSFFVPECSQPPAELSHCLQETNPSCSDISASCEEFTHEGISYSFSRRKKLNPRTQFSQLKLLKLNKGSPLEGGSFPAVPWHTAGCGLYCAFPQPSHSCVYQTGHTAHSILI